MKKIHVLEILIIELDRKWENSWNLLFFSEKTKDCNPYTESDTLGLKSAIQLMSSLTALTIT